MARKRFVFRAGSRTLELGFRTRIMGIVNVTPDSFSDGGAYFEPERAIEHALRLAEAGADILDVGGESTRPGAEPVPLHEELARVLPVIEGLAGNTGVLLSVDTYKAEVAQQAIQAGAHIINDISGLRFDEAMADLAARSAAGVVLMHLRGTPRTMHRLEPHPDIFSLLIRDLENSLNKATAAGIERDRIILDPGIGFGKRASESLMILNRLARLEKFNLPILVGISRKSFIGHVLEREVKNRLMGTAASSAVSIRNGAHLLRVHDVAEIRDVADLVDAILVEKTRAS